MAQKPDETPTGWEQDDPAPYRENWSADRVRNLVRAREETEPAGKPKWLLGQQPDPPEDEVERHEDPQAFAKRIAGH